MTSTSSSRAGRQRAAAASQGAVAEVATAALARGNAIDAVAAGVFAAAAAEPGVLLGPIQLLLGGAGAGLRAIDGRTRQPGVEQPRPRGFREEDAVVAASRVATPALPAALAAALALGGGASLARAIGPALDIARALSPARRGVLQLLARRGAAALGESSVRDELLAVAGRVAGGLLGEGDFDALLPVVLTAAVEKGDELETATVPWGAAAIRDGAQPPFDAGSVEIVAASDGRGLIAIACYEVPSDGLAIDALGLVAPFCAAPVRRGEPRVRPGDPRPAAAPIALAVREGLVELAVGVARSREAELDLGAMLRAAMSGTLDEALAALPRSSTGSLVGIARSRDAARVVADPRRA